MIFSEVDHPWPTDLEIKEIVEKSQKQGLTIKDREYSCFDKSSCNHNKETISYAGDFCVETCSECGRTTSRCEHRNNEWNDAGTMLRCKTCGFDVT